jgi:CheY-like chemotaxis protein/two-component sensor histidine kinase
MDEYTFKERRPVVDLSIARPAAVLVIDLVKHSSRPAAEIRQIQKILEDAFREASKLLNIHDVIHKYTGDGYVCSFLGDSSAKVIDFLNAAIPELKRRFAAHHQTFRIGLDFGLLHLRSNELTRGFEHFDHTGIQAARLENSAQSNQILCTETVFQIFAPHYRHIFPNEPTYCETKDKTILAYEICPFDYIEIQQAFSDYIYATKPEQIPTAPTISRNRILVVDDERNIRDILVEFIKQANPDMEVLSAADAAQAMKVFEPGSFAIVITDVVMPGGMTGMDLTQHLISLDKDLVVIMISGYSAGCASRFYEVGGFRFFSKPFIKNYFIQTINLALNHHLSHLFRNLNVICDNPGKLMLELQLISDSLHSVIEYAKKEGHLAQSLIRHKVKHTISDFVKQIHPGTDILDKAESVRVQMECLSRLAWVTSMSAKSSFPIFLQQYIDDLRKQHRGLNLSLQMERIAIEAAANCSAETILGLVVCELIDNAIGAVSAKGQITIDVAVLASTQQLKVSVHDNGNGIAPENIPLIFDQGFSTKGTGRGLGLHLVREAVQQLGGSIFYETLDGACFTALVPIVMKDS